MVLQLPHTEGGFGVPFNCVTKDASFYTTTSHFVAWLGAFPQERQELWLPKDDLRDSSSWSSPPLVLLCDIHSKLLPQYNCKEEVCEQSQSQVNVGAGAGPSSQSQVNIGAGPRPNSQDGVSQLQEPTPLSLPQLNRLISMRLFWHPYVQWVTRGQGGRFRFRARDAKSMAAVESSKSQQSASRVCTQRSSHACRSC
jgi:hypothetical protein